MSALLEARDLYRFFHVGDEETLALRGVSLSVEAGEIIAVTGPSGSGKSTLLNCLAGLDEPDGGSVHVRGTPLTRRPEPERARVRARSIGILFQSQNLVAHLDVTANVTLARKLAGKPTSPSIPEVIADVGLSTRAHALPSQLSGGEAARAGLAVALANEPAVLLADEPTGELDRATAVDMLGLIRARADAGSAVVLVTHSPVVADAADRVVELRDGTIVQR